MKIIERPYEPKIWLVKYSHFFRCAFICSDDERLNVFWHEADIGLSGYGFKEEEYPYLRDVFDQLEKLGVPIAGDGLEERDKDEVPDGTYPCAIGRSPWGPFFSATKLGGIWDKEGDFGVFADVQDDKVRPPEWPPEAFDDGVVDFEGSDLELVFSAKDVWGGLIVAKKDPAIQERPA